ncbi:hypothetical protein PHLCEN_2v4442 [Hermanssonia centrifuga]|uniref:Uncharacterized protein n=1 Tax=Hermanssonia centrifuga TaxID=98765 RepID=A0A2R6PNI4_9APHY|nr:hypothetical protein PHLCEN_2v4442 [Hermanssonia centrifuga]
MAANNENKQLPLDNVEAIDRTPGIDDMELGEAVEEVHHVVTKEAIETMLQSQMSPSEQLHVNHVIKVARSA